MSRLLPLIVSIQAVEQEASRLLPPGSRQGGTKGSLTGPPGNGLKAASSRLQAVKGPSLALVHLQAPGCKAPSLALVHLQAPGCKAPLLALVHLQAGHQVAVLHSTGAHTAATTVLHYYEEQGGATWCWHYPCCSAPDSGPCSLPGLNSDSGRVCTRSRCK